jgi:hypothetical protein
MLSSGYFPGVWIVYGDVQLHILHAYLPMKMEQTECSETWAYKFQTPGNYPEESIQQSEQDKSLKSGRKMFIYLLYFDSEFL